ncbi:MAG TPA: hypothetical protein DCZ12_11840, partial [Gammaproteobacteria bacterium]|nr:hypothetical protein [Gammaproteobacteria bacterium]
FVKQTQILSSEVTQPYRNSKKIWVEGSRPDIRVGMREIYQSNTQSHLGTEENP